MSHDQLYLITICAAVACLAAASRPRLCAPVAFVAAGALIYLQAFHAWGLVVDDAYISFRYSYNMAHGHGLVFNEGEHVEGYTNFLWVLVLALTERCGLGIVEPSRWIGFAATIGSLGVLWLLARRVVGESRRRADLVFAGTAMTFAALPGTGYWASAGLEEPLFTLLLLTALYRHIVEVDRRGALPLSAAAAVAAALTRPEGALVAGVLFALRMVDTIRLPNDRVWRLATWGAMVAMPMAAYIGWRWSYYGYPLPNTYYQKVGGAPTLDWKRYHDGVTYLRSFWVETGAVLLFPLSLFPLTRADSRRAAVPLVAFGGVWTAYVAYVGGDFMSFHRFMTPVIPAAILLSATAIATMAAQIEPRTGRWRAAVWGAGGLALIAWMMAVPAREVGLDNFRRNARSAAVEIVAWLDTQDQTAYMAIGAAGYMPYESRLRTLDTLGLTDEHIAHGDRLSDGFNVPGHRKGDGAYVIARKPDVIIVFGTLDPLPRSSVAWAQLRDQGRLLGSDTDMLSQLQFWREYEADWVKLPSGKVLNFFRRKDSTKVEGTAAALTSQEESLVRAQDVRGSCDNWILPRPPFLPDFGYFYLSETITASGPPRRAVTTYRTDLPGSPSLVVEMYQRYMEQSHWAFTGTEHAELPDVPGAMFTLARFRAGTRWDARRAFVAVSDDGTQLVTSTDYAGTERESFFYRCMTE